MFWYWLLFTLGCLINQCFIGMIGPRYLSHKAGRAWAQFSYKPDKTRYPKLVRKGFLCCNLCVLSPKAKNSKTQAQPQSDEAQSPKYSGPFQPYKPFYEERVQLVLFSGWLLGMIQNFANIKNSSWWAIAKLGSGTFIASLKLSPGPQF